MKTILFCLFIFSFSVFSVTNAPPALTDSQMGDASTKDRQLARILNYLQIEALNDLLKEFNSMQNKDPSSLTLEERQRRWLMTSYIPKYEAFVSLRRSLEPSKTPITVTCTPPSDNN